MSMGHSLTVGFAPRFLRRMGEYFCSEWPSIAAEGAEAVGLLFGAAAETDSKIQSFRVLETRGRTEASAGRWSEAFEAWRLNAEDDPQLTWLDLLGWYCIRGDGGLFASDVEFHNRYFPGQSTLGVVFHSWMEERITADLYASVPGSPLSLENHRRASIHVSLDSNAAGAPMPLLREKTRDEFYLRAYEVAHALDRQEKWAEWRARLRPITSLGWLSFGRRETRAK